MKPLAAVIATLLYAYDTIRPLPPKRPACPIPPRARHWYEKAQDLGRVSQ